MPVAGLLDVWFKSLCYFEEQQGFAGSLLAELLHMLSLRYTKRELWALGGLAC